MMATHNMYVQIIFDEKTKKFNCYADLGEVLTTLNDGDVFTISQQDTTNVLGTIKYSEDCKPYGYYFVPKTCIVPSREQMYRQLHLPLVFLVK